MKHLFSFFIFLAFVQLLYAQAPEKFSYQAVVRDVNDKIIENQQVGILISIHQSAEDGALVYAEAHQSTTNANGLISLEIGAGTVKSGDFAMINWAEGPYFIKSEIDPAGGDSYSIAGVSEMLSVPYALHARSAHSLVGQEYERMAKLSGSHVLISNPEHFASYRIAGENLEIFVSCKENTSPKISVDVDNNGVADNMTDRAYGLKTGAIMELCTQFIIDAASSTPCGKPSGAVLVKNGRDFNFIIPVREVIKNPGDNVIALTISFYNSDLAETIMYPVNNRGNDFSDVFEINLPVVSNYETLIAPENELRRMSFNVFGAFIPSGNNAFFRHGVGANSGIVLTPSGVSSFSLNFTVPPGYTPGDTMLVRMVASSGDAGAVEISPNFISVGRPEYGFIQGASVTRGLELVFPVDIQIANVPVEILFRMFSPDGLTYIQPGDAISFGVFRRGDSVNDANPGEVKIHSVELLY